MPCSSFYLIIIEIQDSFWRVAQQVRLLRLLTAKKIFFDRVLLLISLQVVAERVLLQLQGLQLSLSCQLLLDTRAQLGLKRCRPLPFRKQLRPGKDRHTCFYLKTHHLGRLYTLLRSLAMVKENCASRIIMKFIHLMDSMVLVLPAVQILWQWLDAKWPALHRSASNSPDKCGTSCGVMLMCSTAHLKASWAVWRLLSLSDALSSPCWRSRLPSRQLSDVDLLPETFCSCSDRSWFWDFCISFSCWGERREK